MIDMTRKIALTVLSLLLLTSPATAAPPPQTHLIFAGSGTNLPIVRVLAEAFARSHPGISIEVPASIGSSSGIRAAADGAIAIGLISRPLKENEKGLGLEIVTYARTPLVIGVHASVAEEEISSSGIVAIYRGEKRTWPNGAEIIVLTREPGDSTIEVMSREVPGFGAIYEESRKAKRWTILLKDLEMNQVLAKTPHALGFSDLGALTVEGHKIKALRVNGVAPTLANAKSGEYPLVKTLMLVYHPEKIPPAAREFLAFIRSPQGTKILLANGYLPEK
ncbi:MAG: substrate-binding domain-containing protein [Desulfuromonadales bacterium]|nr:substrate-binding domain-containing protein [Desulfuromonadales bacterium]